jgi:hypothetical protein
MALADSERGIYTSLGASAGIEALGIQAGMWQNRQELIEIGKWAIEGDMLQQEANQFGYRSQKKI